MFLKKRKEAKEKKLNDEQVQLENKIDSLIVQAEQIADPVEKIEILSNVQQLAYKLIQFETHKVAYKDVNQFFKEDRHANKLLTQWAQTDRLLTEVIENNLKEIARSPSYPKVSKLNGIAVKFANAAAKALAAPEEVAPAETAPPVETKKPKSKTKPRPDFDKIINPT